MEVQEFRPGQQVCQQDAQGDCAYVILSGSVSVFKERAHEERIFVRSLGAGSFFGEGSMLWRTPRTRSVYMDERGPATLGILYREAYHDLVVRSEIKERSRREDYLRRAPVLETLSDEQIAQIADALQTEQYDPDEDIVTQGERGDKLYVILEGTCVVTVKTGTAGDIDIQEHRRIHAGDMFGEKALLENTRRSASVTAVTHVEVLFLKRAAFERMLETKWHDHGRVDAHLRRARDAQKSREDGVAERDAVIRPTGLCEAGPLILSYPFLAGSLIAASARLVIRSSPWEFEFVALKLSV
ncbi:cAMP-dependent protein kinase type I regulatory subunit (DRI class I to class IV) [Durusdinium trenchii]|uniref:cAMP-dependent protein kinase type I regulatory subunit (DRI class I to class IV) n=1 Tax=Durusdinium trenchii TaxID=1381693 RepID=A0ABP0NHZ2_9DINO